MKKILLLIGCIFLITGCKVEYNLEINNDLTVSEEVLMTGTDDFFDIYYKSSRLNVVNMMFSDYEKKKLSENGYKYEIVDGTTPYVLTKKNYNNVSDFKNKTIFVEQYFDDISVLENEGIITLQTEGFYRIEPENPNRYDIASLTIKIKCAYEVLEHNASDYDKNSNTYTWYIGRDTSDFSLNLKYDTNKVFSSSNNDLMLIVGTIIVMGLTLVFAFIWKKNNNYN